MKILYADFMDRKKDFGDDVEAAARFAADHCNSEGELERLRERCENLASTLGRLMAVLPLKPKDLESVLGYSFEVKRGD